MNDDPGTARLEEVESRLAFQEHALQVLSDEIARQQRELEALTRRYLLLLERVQSTESPVYRGTPAEEVPPHY